MAAKNVLKDVINKSHMLVALNLQQMRLLFKIIFKSWIILFFVYLWKNKVISSQEFQESLKKTLLCRSCYPIFALYELHEFKLFNKYYAI